MFCLLTLTNYLFPPCPLPSSQCLSNVFLLFFLASLFLLCKRLFAFSLLLLSTVLKPQFNENNSQLMSVILLCSSCASSSCPSCHGDSLLFGILPATVAASFVVNLLTLYQFNALPSLTIF